MEGHRVHLHASGSTLTEALASLGVSAGPAVSLSLASFSDEQLLAELRQRFAKEGKVVRVAMFEGNEAQADLPLGAAPISSSPSVSPPTNTKAAEPASPRPRGRPPNAGKQVSEEGKAIAAERAAAATPAREAPKTITKDVLDEWDEEPAEAEIKVPNKVTKEDVKAALNQFNAIKGMVTARQMLDRIGGSQKLMDIDAKHYPAIVAEINRELAASAKAAA